MVEWFNSIGITRFRMYFRCFFYIQIKKTNAKLLLYLGLGTIGLGLWQLAGSIDFITILITGNNLPIFIDTSNPLHASFWFFTTLFEFILGIAFLYYVALNLVIPDKKYYLLALFLVIGVVISLFYIFDFDNNINTTDITLGEDVINTTAKLFSPIFFLMILASLLFLGFNVIGLILRSVQSRGIIKNKFLELGIGNLVLLIFFIIYAIFPDSLFKLALRIGVIGSIVIIYFSLRESPEKPVETRPEKEIKIEDGLFRLTKRPDEITEEEVSVSKEKKICLVCKGKVLRFSFICAQCEAFYCENCAKAIMDMENSCWACNEPLDASKPFKPYKKKEEIYVDLNKIDAKLKK